MADLISRAALLNDLSYCAPELWQDEEYIKAKIMKHPAVDAVPVVHARWTTERTWKHDGEWYCSACEYEPVVFMDSTFCPNCGAKMDGERRDSE